MNNANAKIALINPPSNVMGGNKSFKRIDNLIPSLGLGYIAAVLEEEGYKNVNIIESRIEGLSVEDIKKKLMQLGPDIVGISSFTPSYSSAKAVAGMVKKEFPKSVCIVGGPHITATYSDFDRRYFDVGVIGEGEITFLELVRHIEKQGLLNLDKISGIVYNIDGEIKFTGTQSFIDSLDDLPLPSRHLQPSFKKHHPVAASYMRLPQAYMITGRGCPALCTFCDRAVFGEKVRFRSPKNVVDEMEFLINNYGIRDIKFIDDTFTIKKSRVYEICDEIEKRKLKIPWECLTRVTSVDKRLLKRMKDVGCWQVLYGLESGSDRMLKLIKKGTSVEKNTNAVKLAKEAGLNVRADFIVGTPGETEESLYKTLELAIKLDVDYAHFNPFEPLPGTEIYRNLKDQKIGVEWKKTGIMDFKSKKFVPDTLSNDVYDRFLVNAHRKFYLRPQYILKRLFSIKSFDQLKGQFEGFLAILGL